MYHKSRRPFVGSLMDWGIRSLQTVWFKQQSFGDIRPLFAAIVGALPDNFQQQSIGVSLASGTDGTIAFQLVSQPGRLDYFEAPVATEEAKIPLLYDVQRALSQFNERSQRGCPLISEVLRLAVVVTLSIPAERGEAAKILGDNVGIDIPMNDSSDFIFQINRRLVSKSTG